MSDPIMVLGSVVVFIATLLGSLFFFASKFMSVDFSESLDGDLLEEEQEG